MFLFVVMMVWEVNVKYRVKFWEFGKMFWVLLLLFGVLEYVEESFSVEALGMYRIMGKRYVMVVDIDGCVVVFLFLLGNFVNVYGVFFVGFKVFVFCLYNKVVVAFIRRGVAYVDINAFMIKLYVCDGLMCYDIVSVMFDL